ncbi:MAG: molybdenum ABC transporter permease, partial [Synergistetes bacterium]|nr:molybdenum ABC transporter permease [Synergistota bacterium]
SWRHLLTGMTLCGARAISEFGAVIVLAYYPMTAPVLVYHRFEGYGLAYSRPVAVLLILVCLASFLVLRWLSSRDYR